MPREPWIWAAAAGALLVPSAARADDACGKAFSAGPEHVKKGQLVVARDELTVCAADPCPASMRALCANDLHRLEDRIPTIVFVAKDSAGRDLVEVRVSEDDKVLAEKIDGRSMPLDPGNHTFKFERAGAEPISVPVVVHEGEHARAIEAKLPDLPVAKTPAPAAPAPAPKAVLERPIPWTVYAAGGLSIVGAAGFGIFGARGLGQRSDLDPCKGSCSHDSVQSARTSYTIADISLIAGVVFLGATVALYLTRPTVESSKHAALPWPMAF